MRLQDLGLRMNYLKLPDVTEFVGVWYSALAHIISLMFFTHFALMVFFKFEPFHLATFSGNFLYTSFVVFIGYKQKRMKRVIEQKHAISRQGER